MSEITLFENPQFGKVRVVMRGSDPWFVAKDVCDCLDIRTDNAMVSLDDDEKQLLTGEQFLEVKVSCTPYTTGGQENSGSPALTICPPSGLNIISESGFYSLILRSRKPEAKAFKRWVTHEVLPAIRKTGAYSKSPTSYLEALKQCVALEEARLAAEAENAIVQAALGQEQAAHDVTKKELQRALEQLGIAGEFSGVCTQDWIYDYFKSSSQTFRSIGRFLSYALRYHSNLDEYSRDIPVNRWNGKITHVRVYHNKVWKKFRDCVEAGLVTESTKYIGSYLK